MKDRRFLKVSIPIWDGVAGQAGAFGIAALLVGGIFATLEYNDRKIALRAAETLDLIDVWEVRGSQQAFQDISAALRRALEEVGTEDAMTDTEIELFRQNLVRRAMLDPGPEAYDKVIGYFTRLSLCIQADLCSEDVANVFFSETVIDFREWFLPEIEARRRLNPGHARELDWVACRFSIEMKSISSRDPTRCDESG